MLRLHAAEDLGTYPGVVTLASQCAPDEVGYIRHTERPENYSPPQRRIIGGDLRRLDGAPALVVALPPCLDARRLHRWLAPALIRLHR